MSKQTFPIDHSNMDAVKIHIRQQFDQLSWWPAAAPLEAKAEFESQCETPTALAQWCEKWLDGGQWKKLKSAIE